MRFIDLFAGLGGFHLALRGLGHECVFASEIDAVLAANYERNFGIIPAGDIRKVDLDAIPPYDILCAGFPCQPFSKAGEQQGFSCTRWGDLFDRTLEIIRHHAPTYIMLENVQNLLKHDGGRTFALIRDNLQTAGYEVSFRQLSPHRFGVPQIRERVFIVGSRTGLSHFSWPTETPNAELSIKSVLDSNPLDARPLSRQVVACLDVWQEFLQLFPKTNQLPSFPIWSMEFGATYPFEKVTPFALGVNALSTFRGSHGRRLAVLSDAEMMLALPSYARSQQQRFPTWKIQFIRQNRELYQQNKQWIDKWLPKILPFPASYQKLEWNCQGEKRDIWDYVLQFRASGVRIKRPTTSPSLVAMTTTQVPIIGWERRYMTTRECMRLQSLDELEFLPDTANRAYKALGNAVNADIVSKITLSLLATSAADAEPIVAEYCS